MLWCKENIKETNPKLIDYLSIFITEYQDSCSGVWKCVLLTDFFEKTQLTPSENPKTIC